ncbi:TetR/AcrR family transcriptional regulator [Oceanihabitans sediminis]|uniref:TetR/AcrR family transcriptional regulator n=1 Tax=Oceanihabitans sediminis TaxID=1812012 RepID=A0A368P5Y9_9FLAO|nr:TetR/AcrR family transcriptional regulator [Oceanihabitans sediminis]MDX1278518.1 TetR/AcrR family transcriptional regulator [Oceanihabitans sediminis]MDX1772512.1 TetR/AcrR family transcriptional regulator [Oceanihabitans sediminis]RBP34161.1 TetR family transcriptional regulator [Oceanihabitans sediminis]RCU57853.1 TetR/AcrR family transcriptional regulator [Oceanihabitans sediminis]
MKKPETRKEEIINTAAKLFKEKGYSAVTMRDLATAMGMKAASLYNHINSKQDILNAIIISLAEEFRNGMRLIHDSDGSCVDKLKKIIELNVEISRQNSFAMASLNNDWMHLEEKMMYYQKLKKDYETDFRNILITGIEKGEIVNINPDVMMFSMLTTLRSLYIWIPKKEDVNPRELSENLNVILVKGVLT